MEQTMLSIDQKKGAPARIIPNILPCRVHHDGPVGSADSFWSPSTDADAKKTAYFRGRQLHGKVVCVPEGYRGVVVEKKNATAQSAGTLKQREEPEVIDVDGDAEEELPLGGLEAQAEFDEMVIWGHESVAEASADPYARGVDEWMTLAGKIHSYDEGKSP